MKTLVISEGDPLPEALREVVARGSTTVEERRADELDASSVAMLGADRVLFWASRGAEALRTLARQCVRAEAATQKEMIVYVTQASEPAVEGLSPNELFVWPYDEDRLKMAFMTGA